MSVKQVFFFNILQLFFLIFADAAFYNYCPHTLLHNTEFISSFAALVFTLNPTFYVVDISINWIECYCPNKLRPSATFNSVVARRALPLHVRLKFLVH